MLSPVPPENTVLYGMLFYRTPIIANEKLSLAIRGRQRRIESLEANVQI